eukprot:701731-Prymnesium_polylepis.1
MSSLRRPVAPRSATARHPRPTLSPPSPPLVLAAPPAAAGVGRLRRLRGLHLAALRLLQAPLRHQRPAARHAVPLLLLAARRRRARHLPLHELLRPAGMGDRRPRPEARVRRVWLVEAAAHAAAAGHSRRGVVPQGRCARRQQQHDARAAGGGRPPRQHHA